MSVFNRRNALIGWAAWTVAKVVARQKARSAVKAETGGRSKKLVLSAAGAAAAVGAVVFFWRHDSHGPDGPASYDE